MSKKRTATTELNSDNWADDDEPEEAGTFKSVGPDVMSKRVIKVARRKFTKANTEQSRLFSNFSGFGNQNTSPDVKNTFSFLANLNGKSASTTNSSIPSTMPSLISSTPSASSAPVDFESDNSKPTKESLQSTKIKVLNESLLKWIGKWVSKNPTCVLTPVFQDYEKHLESIKAEEEKKNDESKPAEVVPTLKFNFTPVFNDTEKPIANLKSIQSESPTSTLKPADKTAISTSITTSTSSSWLKCGIGSLGENSLNNKPPLLFNFSSKQSFLQNIGKPVKNDASDNKEEGGEDEPPINDFKPITEDDALYSQRVKVFVKSKENYYADRGVGNLFIKEAKNNKGDKIYQAIVRADTTLGNIIFNIRITKDIPTKRVGKNNVMLVCLPTPDSKPPPVAVLLRVKTDEDADKLLAEINKYK